MRDFRIEPYHASLLDKDVAYKELIDYLKNKEKLHIASLKDKCLLIVESFFGPATNAQSLGKQIGLEHFIIGASYDKLLSNLINRIGDKSLNFEEEVGLYRKLTSGGQPINNETSVNTETEVEAMVEEAVTSKKVSMTELTKESIIDIALLSKMNSLESSKKAGDTVRKKFEGTSRLNELKKALVDDEIDIYCEKYASFVITFDSLTSVEEYTLHLMILEIIRQLRIKEDEKIALEKRDGKSQALLENRFHQSMEQYKALEKSLKASREQRLKNRQDNPVNLVTIVQQLNDPKKKKEILVEYQRLKNEKEDWLKSDGAGVVQAEIEGQGGIHDAS